MPTKEMKCVWIRFYPETGFIECRFSPQTIYEDGEVREYPPHLITLHPGADAELYLAENNKHFASGVERRDGSRTTYAQISDADAQSIRAAVNLHHTPEVIARYSAMVEAQRKDMEEEERRERALLESLAAGKPAITQSADRTTRKS